MANSRTAPDSDAHSFLTDRSGVLGRVTASASRETRGNLKYACKGGAEQWGSWSVALMTP